MKSLYLLVVLTLLSFVSNSIDRTADQQFTTSKQVITKNNAVLDLPQIGKIDLNTLSIDSVHHYGSADTWGHITKYSSSTLRFAIDSVDMGIYGSLNRYYLLDTKDNIQAVFTQRGEEPIYNEESHTMTYSFKEELIDFRSETAISLTRSEITSSLTHSLANQRFVESPLKNEQEVHQYFQTEYATAWNAVLEE